MPVEFPTFTSRADLEQLLAAGQNEDDHYEFKESTALRRDDDATNELYRDVSAFANTDGGMIIYGIGEDKVGKTYFIDSGVEDSKITREWIDQKLMSNISPPMRGVGIDEFPISDKGRAFVISVRATMNGPHQCPDRKYYRRSETSRPAMTDREIRDVMGRAVTPEPFVELRLNGLPDLVEGNARYKQFDLIVKAGNRSAQPLLFGVFRLGLDSECDYRSIGDWERSVTSTFEGRTLKWISNNYMAPPQMPIFRETKCKIGGPAIRFVAPISPFGSVYRLQTAVYATGLIIGEEHRLVISQMQTSLQGPKSVSVPPIS
jgi:hypothetical protein